MKTYPWTFPLPRTHTGMLQSNGTLGVMIWGEANVLRVTLGRADLWDHRGGMPWREGMSYSNIRECLEQKDVRRLRRLFVGMPPPPGQPARPSIMPVGRIDLELPRGAVLERGDLDVRTGTIRITVRHRSRRVGIRILTDMHANRICIDLPDALSRCKLVPVPAWDYVGDKLKAISFDPPTRIRSRGITGWVQPLPEDPPVAVAAARSGNRITVAVERGADAGAARDIAVATARPRSAAAIKRANTRWWNRYWRRVPTIQIPNARLAFLYDYGMYKFASFTNPAGTPATLQGPWIEEYRLPPWSSDYHFNINVQMCYQPAYHGNCLEHLMPLFEMIFSWEDVLRHNARVFLGIDDGAMLPHAVDDRCTCMGGFWSGSVDHACTAWVALMMWRSYRYSMDRAFLRRAYPFMCAAMRVYEAMLDRDGNKLALAVGVSPEYRGDAMDAWGTNASFQLACIHALAEACCAAAKTLRKPPAPAWARILKRLPKAALVENNGRPVIGLWDGLALEESHRHHSHLAAITPFDVIDPDSEEWRQVVSDSVADWITRGPGQWSGWCLSWAAAIHTRLDNGDAAEFWLESFDKFFTNEGDGTLHDASADGLTILGRLTADGRPIRANDIMQMDGGMGTTAVIQEMLIHTRRGVTHLFAGAPGRWRDCAFKRMRTEGAFIISAERCDGVVTSVTVNSECGGTLRLANPWPGSAAVAVRGRTRKRIKGGVLRLAMKTGETLRLVASST